MDNNVNRPPRKLGLSSKGECRAALLYTLVGCVIECHVGSFQGRLISEEPIWDVVPNAKVEKDRMETCHAAKNGGGSPTPCHLLRPGMCDTSTSTWEIEIRSQLKNNAIGIWVEKSLLETASAVVSSESVGILVGILDPEKMGRYFN